MKVNVTVKLQLDTACLECSRGRRNSWCSGEMLRYHEELRLRRQHLLAATDVRLSVGIKQGLDTQVVHTVNDEYSLFAIYGKQPSSALSIPLGSTPATVKLKGDGGPHKRKEHVV